MQKNVSNNLRYLVVWSNNPKQSKANRMLAVFMENVCLSAATVVVLFSGMFASFGQATGYDSIEVSLQQLFARADTANLSLQAFRHRSLADSARIGAARAVLLPQVGADGDLSFLDIVPRTKESYIGDGPADVLLSAGVSQKIWDGGRTRAEILALEAARAVTGADTTVRRQSIRLRIAESYFRLSGLRRELAVIDENISMIDERIRLAGLLIDAGRLSEIDRGRFEVARAQLEGRRLQTEHAYESASRAIAVLCNIDTEALFVPADDLDYKAVLMPTESIDDTASLANAPVIAKQTALVERARAEIEKAQTTRMPSVSGKVWYGWEFATAGFSFRENDRWFAGIHATVPIFDGYAFRNKMAAAQNAFESARLEREEWLREAVSSAQVLSDALAVLRDRITIAENAAAQAQKNLRLGVIEYEAGRRSNMDIIDMQNSVLQAQLEVVSLLVEYNTTQSRIRSLAGDL